MWTLHLLEDFSGPGNTTVINNSSLERVRKAGKYHANILPNFLLVKKKNEDEKKVIFFYACYNHDFHTEERAILLDHKYIIFFP